MHIECTEDPFPIETFRVIAHSTGVTPRRIRMCDLHLEPLRRAWLQSALRDSMSFVQNAPQRLVGSNVIAALLQQPMRMPKHLRIESKKIVALGTLYHDRDNKSVFCCIIAGRTNGFFRPESENSQDGVVLCLKETPFPI
jgi:hypothetical protein